MISQVKDYDNMTILYKSIDNKGWAVSFGVQSNLKG